MKEKLSLIYKIIIVIVSGIGIYLNLKAFTPVGAVIYYTIQSNIWCFVFYLITVILMFIKKLEKNNIYYIFKGMVTMAITITMFVYQILLSSDASMNAYQNLQLECNFVHLFTPLLVITDYIIFGEKGNLKKSYPFIWSLTLVAYMIFDLLYVAIGGTFGDNLTYPYFYMDVDMYGVFGVFINCLFVYVFFIGYGTIVQTLDNKLGERRKKKLS